MDDDDDATRAQLEKLGAQYAGDELGGSYVYQHNWLWRALQLDPTGPIGVLARIRLLEVGYDTSGVCGNGTDTFVPVIREGEALLKQPLADDQRAYVHFLVGRAYSTIVALASGFDRGWGYVEPKDYQARALAARGKAIHHYRAFLASSPEGTLAKSAWRDAWRLLAGLSPDAHYYCIYD